MPSYISGIAQTVDVLSALVEGNEQWYGCQVIYLVFPRQWMSCQHWKKGRSSDGGAKLCIWYCPDSGCPVSTGSKEGVVTEVPSYISGNVQTYVLSALVVRKEQWYGCQVIYLVFPRQWMCCQHW